MEGILSKVPLKDRRIDSTDNSVIKSTRKTLYIILRQFNYQKYQKNINYDYSIVSAFPARLITNYYDIPAGWKYF